MSKRVESVLQEDLHRWVQAAEDIKSVRKRLADMEAALAQVEVDIMGKLNAGGRVEAGRYTAAIEMRKGQIRPAWKNLYVDHFVAEHAMAAEMIEQQARKTCTPSITPTLVVGVSLVQVQVK